MSFLPSTPRSTAAQLRLALLLLLAVCGPAGAVPVLDPLFLENCKTDPGTTDAGSLVMQGRFPGDGTDLRSRLFGSADSNSSFAIEFSSDDADVKLNGVPLKGAPQTITVTPGRGAANPWEWEGELSCPETGGKVGLAIAGGKPLTLLLGDVWVIASGDNALHPSKLTPDADQFCRVTGTKDGILGFTARKRETTPHPGELSDVPLLAAYFASQLVTDTKRPQAVCVVPQRQARAGNWEPASKIWASMFGRTTAHSKPLSVRGIVWWIGEWDAERAELPFPLPGSAQKPGEWAKVEAEWQKQRREELLKVTRGIPTIFSQPSMISLMVGLQAVRRQPLHFDTFDWDHEPTGTWELYRGAQSEAVTTLRAEKAHAALVSAIPAQLAVANTPDFGRWFWADSRTFQYLAQHLAAAARRRNTATLQDVREIGPPTVVWKDDGSASLTFEGQVGGLPPSFAAGEARLEYSLSNEPDKWLPLPVPWTNPLSQTGAPENPVRAIRYGRGDWPKTKLTIADENAKEAGFIPPFRFHRP